MVIIWFRLIRLGLFQTRLFVTHGITYLPEVDVIVVLKDGYISEIGTYKELLEKKGAFSEFLTTYLQDVDENFEGYYLIIHFIFLCW